MRRLLFLFFMLIMSVSVYTQNSQNPFDLSSSTPEETEIIEQAIIEENITPEANENPFDLGSETSISIETENEEESTAIEPINGNPFDLETSLNTAPGLPDPESETIVLISTQEEENQEKSKNTNGWVLSLTLFILAFATFVFIFFRSLYGKVYKAILNDNQLSLLYRERTSGTIGSFIIAYILFFLSTGLFIYLTLLHFKQIPEGSELKQYMLITASLTALFVVKHFVLALIGYVFPINKEMRLYGFSIMVFSILLGILMPLADLILAYSTESNKNLIIYFVGGFVLIVYLLRSIRAFFIANRFVFNFSFHFLLYLCTVEIVPALILYKILYNN